MSADFDFSELRTLAADLGEAGVAVVPFARQAVEVTAVNVKKAWKPAAKVSNVKGNVARLYSSSIDYDMKLDTDGEIGAEIGPNPEKPGGTMGMLEDGGDDMKSAPQHAGRDAARANEADFIRGIERAGRDAFG